MKSCGRYPTTVTERAAAAAAAENTGRHGGMSLAGWSVAFTTWPNVPAVCEEQGSPWVLCYLSKGKGGVW